MSDGMTHEVASEALEALALDALDASEREGVIAHVAGCAECQRELAALEDTASEIALAAAPLPMPPAQRDRIFDSFFTTKAHGMGLGLSIARSLVDAHGGRIRVDNNTDGGATFRFTLPCAGLDAIESRSGGHAIG